MQYTEVPLARMKGTEIGSKTTFWNTEAYVGGNKCREVKF